MDVKLAQYRAQKRRAQLIEVSKEKIISLFQRRKSTNEMGECALLLKDEKQEEEEDQASVSSVLSEPLEDDQICDKQTYAKISVYASLWLILFSLAIYMEFGAVYFVISLLYIIWANTRTGPKRRGEISAYSVFNPNCEAIDGTLKPEQLQREMAFGIL